jgi:hypothetical protein
VPVTQLTSTEPSFPVVTDWKSHDAATVPEVSKRARPEAFGSACE